MYASGCCLNQVLSDYPLPDGDLRDAWCRTGISSIPERYYRRVYRIFGLQADARRMSFRFLVFPYLTAE